MGAQRGRRPAQNHREAEKVPGLGPAASSPQPVPFCLRGDSAKPCFTSPFPPTLNYLARVVRALLSSGLGVEALRNTRTPDNGLQTPQSSAQCGWCLWEHSDGQGADTH